MYVHIHASHVQVEIHDLYQNMKNEGFQSWVQTPGISEIEYEGSAWLVLQLKNWKAKVLPQVMEALGFEPRSKGLFHVSLFQSLIMYSDDL